MCRQTFSTRGNLRMHMRAHRSRSVEIDTINDAPPKRTPEGAFGCPLCEFETTVRSRYNRHLNAAHVRPQPDQVHLNNLWCYALAKKEPGTKYYEAKRQRDEAQREAEEMEIHLIEVVNESVNGSPRQQVYVPVKSLEGADVEVSSDGNTLTIKGGDSEVLGKTVESNGAEVNQEGKLQTPRGNH